MQLNKSDRLVSFLFTELKNRLTRSTPICSSNWRTQESTGEPALTWWCLGQGGAGQGSKSWDQDPSEPGHCALLKLPLKKPALRSEVGPADSVSSKSSS